jgi:nucleotide-binding universal stress UspA family protein
MPGIPEEGADQRQHHQHPRAVDFSAHSDRAFRYATTLAHRLGAKLALLHVVEDPFVTGAGSSDVYAPNVPELLDNSIKGAERQLATLEESAAARRLLR